MSQTAEDRKLLDTLEEDSLEPVEERLSNPSRLRQLHNHFAVGDAQGSLNRSKIKKLMNFSPPYSRAKLRAKGQRDRFNINYGLGAAIKNEAVGAFLDIISSPERLVNIPLTEEVEESMRDEWGMIMSEEWTKMVRAWDGWLPRMMNLIEDFVTYGVSVPIFDDAINWKFDAYSLEECKFPKTAPANATGVETMCALREIPADVLVRKIVGLSDSWEDQTGWNPKAVKRAIDDAMEGHNESSDEHWNFEKIEREYKSNQLYIAEVLPKVQLIYGWVRENNGKVSMYVCAQQATTDSGGTPMQDEWLFRQTEMFDDASQAFQIFPFTVGDKNKIYTVRGLGYPIFEASTADNILRSKLNDVAVSRAGDQWQPESMDDARRVEFVDFGAGTMAPPGLKKLPMENHIPLDKSLTIAIDANKSVLERHSGGLASTDYFLNPSNRKTKLETAAGLEHFAKLHQFAVSLFTPPLDKMEREMVRRAFQVSQRDIRTTNETKKMRERCLARGVPEDAFDKIYLDGVRSYRVIGNGSRMSKLLIFDQLSQLYSTMDPQGQENFIYDYLMLLVGPEHAPRYKARPGTRRPHIDEHFARLENFMLLEGDAVPPQDGENRMVHLKSHMDEIEAGLVGIEEGQVVFWEFAYKFAQLFNHISQTIEVTTVHEDVLDEFNAIVQRAQQISEIVENGMREMAKMEREGTLPPNPNAEGGQGQGQEMDPEKQMNLQYKQAEMSAKIQKLNLDVQKAAVSIELMKKKSAAELDVLRQRAMGEIVLKDREARAKVEQDKRSLMK